MSVGIANLSLSYISRTQTLETSRAGPGETGQGVDRAEGAEGKDRTDLSPRVQTRLIEMRAMVQALQSTTSEAGKALGWGGAGGKELNRFLAGLLGRHAEAFAPDEEGLAPIDRLAAEFTPEKTAERIFSFAASHYGRWLDGREDSTENREAFVEFIGAAVEKGFGEAQGILGALPDAVQGGIDRTHEIVFNLFADFVENGPSMDADEAASVLAQGRAFNAAFSPVAEDRDAFFEELLGRLGPDGVLRLDPAPAAPASLVNLVG